METIRPMQNGKQAIKTRGESGGTMWVLVGVVVGLILHRFIIAPIERKKVREECISKGLVPRNMI